jgi:hypothetical protein
MMGGSRLKVWTQARAFNNSQIETNGPLSCIHKLELITDITVVSFVLLECSPLAQKELGKKVRFCRRCAFREVLRFRIGSMS